MGEDIGGEGFSKKRPLDDGFLNLGKNSFDEEKVSIGWPGEIVDLADEGIGGDELIEIRLADGRVNGFAGSGEVEINRNLVGKEDCDVGDESGFPRGENNTDAILLGSGFDFLGESDGSSEDFPVGDLRIIRAVVEVI